MSHTFFPAMKNTFCLLLAVATLTSARAEVFRSHAGDRSRGDVTVSAHRSGDHRGSHRDYGRHDHGRRDHGRTHVHVGFGYGRNYGYYSPSHYGTRWDYGYYSPYRAWPAYSYYPGYSVDYPYYGTYGSYGYGNGSYAANGLVLGALAGGIIGHNSGEFRHNGWRGAAWGAGVGWLLGAVADANRRPVGYSAPQVVAQPAAVIPQQTQVAAPAQPQQVTIINNYYNSSTPMSGANSLFGR